MGCSNTVNASKPIPVLQKQTTYITPAIIRRNLKTEIFKNTTKIRSWEERVAKLQSDLYRLDETDEYCGKVTEIETEIKDLKSKIFQYQTHCMILNLHLESAAPGKNLERMSTKNNLKSRNTGLSKASTGTLSKRKFDWRITDASTAYLATKQSNISEEDIANRSFISSSEERELVF